MGTSLILHSPPEAVAWALSGNLGDPEFATDSADLNDGCPANRTEIEWGSGTQTTSSVLELQALWDVAQPVRVIAMRDTSLPVGAKVIVKGLRSGDTDYTYNLGGNSQTQNIFEFVDGSTGIIVVCPATNDPLIGVQVEIWNNLSGATFIAANEHIFIGDIDFYQAFEPPDNVEYDWKLSFTNVGVDRRTPNMQPRKLKSRPAGAVNVGLTWAPFTVAFGNSGAPTSMDYDKLAYVLCNGDKAGAIVRYVDTAGALDTWAMHRTATIGVAANIERPNGQGGNFFTMGFAINEATPGN